MRVWSNHGGKMVWAQPQYSREQVNQAGRIVTEFNDLEFGDEYLERFDEFVDALQIVNNWRSSHGYPLNTFQATLRKRGSRVGRGSIYATRIKRLESITKKLGKHSDMKLTQMQDIGGLRAIMQNCKDAINLSHVYTDNTTYHSFSKMNDYLVSPKVDGYRGIHLIYKYKNRGGNPKYDDLKLEIQLRSILQHAWATAVETVGIFTKQALKSSEGDKDWLRFFVLASAIIAEKEGGAPVPGVTADTIERNSEIMDLGRSLNVRGVLNTYQMMLKSLERHSVRDAKYFLLYIEPEQKKIVARGFLTRDSIEANKQYTELEKNLSQKEGGQAVLVKVDSLSALRKAYPNYFADTTRFIGAIDEFIPK